MKKNILSIVGGFLLLLTGSYLIYWYKYKSELFLVTNVAKPAVFYYDRLHKSTTIIKLTVKGEISGKGTIMVYSCRSVDELRPQRNLASIFLNLSGKIDTTVSREYYSDQACIFYNPTNINRGRLRISIR